MVTQHRRRARLGRVVGLGLVLACLSFPTVAAEYWFDEDDHVRSFSGTVAFVDLKAAFLSAEDKKREEMRGFYVTSESDIRKGKESIKLKDVREGDEVSITYHEEVSGNEVVRLEVVRE